MPKQPKIMNALMTNTPSIGKMIKDTAPPKPAKTRGIVNLIKTPKVK